MTRTVLFLDNGGSKLHAILLHERRSGGVGSATSAGSLVVTRCFSCPNALGVTSTGTKFVGSELEDPKNALQSLRLRRPLGLGSFLVDAPAQAIVWEHVLAKVGIVDESAMELIVTVPHHTPAEEVPPRWYWLCFQRFKFLSVSFVSSAAIGLSIYRLQKKVMPPPAVFVLDLGFNNCSVTPLFQTDALSYTVVSKAILRHDLGGKHLAFKLRQMVSYSQVNLMDDPWISERGLLRTLSLLHRGIPCRFVLPTVPRAAPFGAVDFDMRRTRGLKRYLDRLKEGDVSGGDSSSTSEEDDDDDADLILARAEQDGKDLVPSGGLGYYNSSSRRLPRYGKSKPDDTSTEYAVYVDVERYAIPELLFRPCVFGDINATIGPNLSVLTLCSPPFLERGVGGVLPVTRNLAAQTRSASGRLVKATLAAGEGKDAGSASIPSLGMISASAPLALPSCGIVEMTELSIRQLLPDFLLQDVGEGAIKETKESNTPPVLILLQGGLLRIPGVRERFILELSARFPPGTVTIDGVRDGDDVSKNDADVYGATTETIGSLLSHLLSSSANHPEQSKSASAPPPKKKAKTEAKKADADATESSTPTCHRWPLFEEQKLLRATINALEKQKGITAAVNRVALALEELV